MNKSLTNLSTIKLWRMYFSWLHNQKVPSGGVLGKRYFENMQQIYRRIPMPKYDFNKVANRPRHGCSPVNLLHVFRTPFPKNTSEGLLLKNAEDFHWRFDRKNYSSY